MIVRSNGVVTYVGKVIAYQFWKLGLLGRDFHYRVFTDRSNGPLWATSTTAGRTDHPLFGGAAYVYNVIDVRQSYLQKLLKQALIAVGHPEGAERSHHFSYEMVALSHATARELGFAQVSVSHEVAPLIKLVGRGDTTVVDSYLSPILRRYVDRVASGLAEGTRLLTLDTGKVEVPCDSRDEPDLVIEADADVLAGLLSGAMSLDAARKSGRLRLKGTRAEAARLLEMFRFPSFA